MRPTSVRYRLQWLIIGIFCGVFLSFTIDTVLFRTWREGYIAIQVHYRDGRPAPGLRVEVRPLGSDAVQYIPRGPRLNMELLTTHADGTWQASNTEHYGRYEVQLFRGDTLPRTPIDRQQFMVWPFHWATNVQIVLDQNEP